MSAFRNRTSTGGINAQVFRNRPFSHAVAQGSAVVLPPFWTNGYGGVASGPVRRHELFSAQPDTGLSTLTGADSATGVDAATDVQVIVSSADSASGTDAGTAAITLGGSDAAVGTDAQLSIVSPVTGSESAVGTDAGAIAATVPGSDSATGADAASAPAVTGSSSESGTLTDAGAVSATLPGSDSATATDAGTVVDVTGGPTLVSDADAGTAQDAGTLVDLTPPVVEEEDLGDVSSIYPVEFRALSGADVGYAHDRAELVDLTPKQRPKVFLPRPSAFREIHDSDKGISAENGRAVRLLVGTDAGRASDLGELFDLTADAEDEDTAILLLLGDL